MLDKDGTIFDIHHYWCSMVSLRAKHFAKLLFSTQPELRQEKIISGLESIMGVLHAERKLSKDGPVGIKPRSYIVKVVCNYLCENGASITEEKVEEEFKKVDQQSMENIKDLLNILPGVETFLESCLQHDLKISVATTDIKSRAKLALESRGLNHYFNFIAGGDCVSHTKPAPDMGLRILNELSVHAENAVMIGDHAVDLVMAKNAKLLAGIGVTTGLSSKSNLLETSDYVVENLNQIRIINEK